jgi:guanine deaminase
MASSSQLFYGSFVHSLSLTELEHSVDSLIYVRNGVIEWVEKDVHSSQVQEVALTRGLVIGDGSVEVVELGGDFLCPGLIDTHTVSEIYQVILTDDSRLTRLIDLLQHAPQYPNLGLGQSYQLLDWLKRLTFPTETKFSDLEYARKVYEEVVKRNLAVGVSAPICRPILQTRH